MTGTGKIKTCSICGTTGEVGVLFYASRSAHCKPCSVKLINEHIREINDATRNTAENHYQPWSEDEVEVLLRGLAEGMHLREVAELLGRTYLACHAKLAHLRQKLAAGETVTYVRRTVTVTRTTMRRNPNYVASQPDEDRWWDADYYRTPKGEGK